MVIKDLELKFGQEKDCALGHFDVVLGQLTLRSVQLLRTATTPFDKVEYLGQDEVHM